MDSKDESNNMKNLIVTPENPEGILVDYTAEEEAMRLKSIELDKAEQLDYSRNRQAEYPPMEDQLDYIYHNGVDKWKTDMIDPVKNKYPKG